MAPDTIRMAILDCLENLEKEDKDKFLYQLIHRGGDPKVRRNKVEGKSLLQITDTLVNTFTEPVAYEVTVELLNKIGCSDDAKELAQVVKSLTSSTPSSSGGLHFIDKHRVALINRVTNLDAILDELLGQFIDSAGYSKVRAKPTNEEKMREILDVAMKGGTKCKDILYEILERHEKYLLEELNNA
ncbi:apoptosis-associated speck-like protein containing a CARD isoform X2 [Sphaeramia orbicularis]|uniref:Apoptosis-associated speck-like protein containing a CARD n=1 Tax=Sphaeramia orbicularis TaxID=375764 RepID=A0A673A3C7_9TELE|nr:apoptosis-associated speck-like protein containing a CARD isoform X2 [Sphaeramia orbicularis]